MAWLYLAIFLLAVFPANATSPEDRPGQKFHIRASEMPVPYATRSVSNRMDVIRRDDTQVPVAPEGYEVSVFASGLSHARWMTVAPSGEVFLAQTGIDEVTVLIDSDGDGRADETAPFVTGLEGPHGLAFRDGYLYVADLQGIWRLPYRAGQRSAGQAPERITPPGVFGVAGGHWTRNLAFDADGRFIYAAIGSITNIGEELPPRATIMRFNADGTGGRVFASGLRNPVGIAVHPRTGALYTAVNERDGLGDGLVPDYLTSVRDGGFYGWPYAYIGPNPQPFFAERRPDLVQESIVPEVLFQSHSAPLGLVFADSDQFPPDWRDDALVALHGSWNATTPTGYKVVRVPFENGRPTGSYENFVTGFWVDTKEDWRGNSIAQVIGRPAGLALARDGSLLIADDAANVVWRVRKRP